MEAEIWGRGQGKGFKGFKAERWRQKYGQEGNYFSASIFLPYSGSSLKLALVFGGVFRDFAVTGNPVGRGIAIQFAAEEVFPGKAGEQTDRGDDEEEEQRQ